MAAPRKKAVAKKAAPRRKAAKPKRTIVPALAALDADAQKFLAQRVMAHPGGCDSGKREFLQGLGIEEPPHMATVTLYVKVPVTGSTNQWGETSQTQQKQAKDAITPHLDAICNLIGDAIIIPDEIEVD